ncbi:hypothetical protein D3C86_1374310 [compost metagenome]
MWVLLSLLGQESSHVNNPQQGEDQQDPGENQTEVGAKVKQRGVEFLGADVDGGAVIEVVVPDA